MTGKIDARLAELGHDLPDAAAPVANYVPFATSGSLVFISGQLPLKDGKLLYTGKVGPSVSVEEAAAAAQQSALNVIAQLKAACGGDLDRVKQVIKLGGFVAAGDEFTSHPKVINGASDLMVDVFGDAGRHARAAVGCPSLPLDAPVEVEAIIEIA
ncbi:MAG: RidA family protein [Rhodospirillaceae bacterium]|jgi:enamine deaminase RidA (YjgF/YER057c/UK114 family)|nr:RidA family protein [Rhodospirillaceae bacterium]MBT5241816.1 RidA family protein [Rhodospirillaceae bacterium]MBT5564779.1 RidA family protein [Rhodospirillaceae bacterium]MBT6087962.1 RidA family protein [Rhodospirillaceae bacterium]